MQQSIKAVVAFSSVCFLGLSLGSTALADLGDPGKIAWATLVLTSGEQREVMVSVIRAHYELKDSRVGYERVGKDQQKNVTWLDPKLTEQKISFEWKELASAAVVFSDGRRTSSLSVAYPYTAPCQPVRTEELELSKLRLIHLHYQVSPEKWAELWKKFSRTESLKTCSLASCYQGGDGDCTVSYDPGKLNKEGVKHAIEFYYDAVAGQYGNLAEPWREKAAKLPPDLKDIHEQVITLYSLMQVQYERNQGCAQANPRGHTLCSIDAVEASTRDKKISELRGLIESKMEPWLKKWKVTFVTDDPFSEESRWLPAVPPKK